MTKTMKIIFTLSILINLVLIGAVGGNFYKHHKKHGLPIPKELSVESRAKLEENMKQSRGEMREQFKALKKNHEVLQNIVSAEQFDHEAYKVAVNKILDAKDELGRQKAEMMGNVLSELSLEERKKLSAKLLKSLSFKHGRKGPKHFSE